MITDGRCLGRALCWPFLRDLDLVDLHKPRARATDDLVLPIPANSRAGCARPAGAATPSRKLVRNGGGCRTLIGIATGHPATRHGGPAPAQQPEQRRRPTGQGPTAAWNNRAATRAATARSANIKRIAAGPIQAMKG